MAEPTIAEFLSGMQKNFLAEKAAGLEAVIQLKFSGTDPSEWAIIIKDQTCTFQPGLVQGAKLTITVNSEDFVRLFTGKMDAMQAYMQGKIRVAGDISLALKLMNLFKLQ